ncbi:aldehyde dehydrogenase family protein [Jatrophihabitans sp. DSM 45814]
MAHPVNDVTTGVFASTNPVTGELIASFDVHSATQVEEVAAAARRAAAWWTKLGEPSRRNRLTAWRAYLVSHTEELAALVHDESGKSVPDAIVEVTIAVAHLSWATHHARKVLGRRRVAPGILAVNHSATLEYLPFGVVGVIGPWNYPVHTPMGSISYALAAGNAVVFKPSEFTPTVGKWLVDSFAAVVPESPVLQLVTGLGPTGQALCRAGVDKVAFTGSARTGKIVMATCAETLTPCVIEGGGKDALIVAADADLDLAASQTVWGAMYNAGQTCAGVERVYAEASVYDSFTAKVVELARGLRVGDGVGSDYGAITMPRQIDTIASHVDQALAHGARSPVGGRHSVRAPFVDPVVLVDVAEADAAMMEETFGPVVAITKVDNLEQAIALANSGSYGLGASVFSKRQGPKIARRLTAGMVSINSVLTFAFIPALPWGGSGTSGFGRIHGPDGLREFARSRAITQQRYRIPLVLSTFDRKEKAVSQLQQIARLRWGRSPGAAKRRPWQPRAAAGEGDAGLGGTGRGYNGVPERDPLENNMLGP